MRSGLAALVLALLAAGAHAHTGSSSHLYLDEQAGRLSVDVALIDALQLVDLNQDANGSVTWAEVMSSQTSLVDLVAAGVQVAAGDATCRLAAVRDALSLVGYGGDPYLRIVFGVDCPAESEADERILRYRLLFDVNPAHRALLQVTGTAHDGVWVLSADDPAIRLSVRRPALDVAAGFAAEGIRHILSGYDHPVFLFLLILPVAGQRPIRAYALRIGSIVTAFTLAHSMTLAAGATGLVTLPAKLVEIGIAASIVLAAAFNVLRPSHAPGWKMAFAFGLLHGFGFAGALAELGLQKQALLVSLLSFNIGVEAGQLLIVAAAVPVLAWLSVSPVYCSCMVPAASCACAAIGAMWTAARF